MQSSVIIQPDPIEDNSTRKAALGIYILYLLAFIPFLAIAAIVFAYVFENDAKNTLTSHYRYLIRSFWIGILYFGIASVLTLFLIGMLLMPLCLIWWFIRMAKGLKSLLRREPIANPKTWLF
jgi:uncharacterized membrane protein